MRVFRFWNFLPWKENEVELNRKTLILGVALFSMSAFGDWSRNVSRWGTSDWGEGEAYKIAHKAVDSELEALRKQCTQEGGVFRSSKRQGFCDPRDPRDPFGSDTCAVHGTAYCFSDSGYLEKDVEVSELNGDGDGVFDPGEEVKIDVKVKNPNRIAIIDLKVSLTVGAGNQALEVTSGGASLGTLIPSETKTASLRGKVPGTASCGATTLLKFTLRSRSSTGREFTQQSSQPFGVGKLAAEPIVVSQEGVSMPLTKEVVSYPIQVDGSDAEIYQVKLSYSAFVQQPANYRAWLTSPDEKVSWSFIPDETRRNVIFNEDLTELFGGSKVKGEWYLSGDIRSADNIATITGYRLSITPNIFKCD